MPNLIIVSNRLPVSVKKVDGKLEFFPSAGGLATGLSSYTTNGKSKWIGWPGLVNEDLDDADRKEIARELKKYNCYPVFMSKNLLDSYYNGYSNGVLWPLFHHLEIKAGNTPANWKAYKDANRLFTDEVLRLSKPGSTVWVHDYQLLLVPEMLRVARPKDKIGFFLHIPFPKAEVLFTIKQATKLLGGVLGADLVGLHTKGYVDNFLESCSQTTLGAVAESKVALPDRIVRVTDFPMGIDYEKFANITKQREVAVEYKKLQWKYRGKKVILMSDRLDPTKGLVERLTAYQTFLRKNPALHGQVVMAMIAVPSRTDIDEYKKLRQQVESVVEAIKKEFGTAQWDPIEYMFEAQPFARYAALYRRADVAFIAPVRDGMNLVAKEYLAAAPKHDGILVLSETAGAAEELHDAIMVNPAKPKSMVEGLTKAFTMQPAEIHRRTANMQRHLKYFTVERWAENFMTSLSKPIQTPKVPITTTLSGKHESGLIADYHQAQKRLLLLDYDGTLQPYANRPEEATPDPRVLKTLKRLSQDDANDIVVISGRTKNDLSEWFGDLPIGLAAEHGALFRRKGGKNWHRTIKTNPVWKDEVYALFKYYSELTPGAHVEQKDWSIVWHFRGASSYYSQKHLVILKRLLKPIAKNYNLTVQDGQKSLEVNPLEINKGRIGEEWLIHDHDFVLAMGDDTTDEDMFTAVPPDSYSIKVGRGPTKANYRLPDVSAVHRLLRKL